MKVPIHNRRHRIVAWAQVDLQDFERVAERGWCLVNGYAQGRPEPGALPMFMHRFILDLPGGGRGQSMVDHINGDKLDNRRANLRLVDASANGQNRRGGQGTTSTHRGVSFRADRGKWRAHAKLAGRFIHIGHFDTEMAAAEAAADFRRKHMPFATRDQIAV